MGRMMLAAIIVIVIAVLGFAAALIHDRMMQTAIIVIAVLGWITSAWIYLRRGLNRLPEVSDEEFLRRFAKRFSAPSDRVLEARRQVARNLWVPSRKLAPEHAFEEFTRQLDLFGHLGMGWDNLEELVADAAWRAGEPRPAQALGTCPTVGDLVAGLIRAEAAAPAADAGPEGQ
jgi:hypothetical protein